MNMSQHAKRIHQKEAALAKKVSLARALGNGLDLSTPHKYAERPIMRCGNSNCVMCGNPRKFTGEVTLAEKLALRMDKFAFD